jgi:hypothetical protein
VTLKIHYQVTTDKTYTLDREAQVTLHTDEKVEVPMVYTGTVVDPYDLHFRLEYQQDWQATFLKDSVALYSYNPQAGAAGIAGYLLRQLFAQGGPKAPNLTFYAAIEPPAGYPQGYKFLNVTHGQDIGPTTISDTQFQVQFSVTSTTRSTTYFPSGLPPSVDNPCQSGQ